MFEKVNPCHPDKVADRIAGAIVDLAYAKSENPKVAVEVLIGHGIATVIIETSEDIKESEVCAIVKRIAGDDVVTTATIVKWQLLPKKAILRFRSFRYMQEMPAPRN